MKLAIIFIGTFKYIDFFENYYNAIRNNFLKNTEKDIFVFTDEIDNDLFKKDNVKITFIEHQSWPFITLHRFKYINLVKDQLKEYDKVLFLDADMVINREITEDEFFCHDKAFFGVNHPSFNDGAVGTYETRPESLAYVNVGEDDVSHYYQGCLWGGDVPRIFELIDELEINIDKDLDNDIIAKWHDESHLNRFLITHQDEVYAYDSGFCYPINWNIPYERKILHLEKNNQVMHT